MAKPIDDMTLPEIQAEIEGMGEHIFSLEYLERYDYHKRGERPFWVWHAVLWTSDMECVWWANENTELDAARAALEWLRREK